MPLLGFAFGHFQRALIIFAVVLPIAYAVRAAEVDGVQLPATLQADGKTLHLNGFGLRTYSILGIHIYVAGLYLEHISHDPNQIILSPETKLLTVKFKHDVSAEDSRKAWREGLANNCIAPCQVDPRDVAQFLAQVPAMHAGDSYSLLFTQHGATVTASGRQIGVVNHRQFAEALLATFLGPKPASQRLKRELLGEPP